MPMRADRDARERQITDAVCRITIKGGLQAATFREVAAEAGVSVRLVQYYFGTKDRLLLATQRRVAERSVERIQRLRAGGSDAPVEVLRTIMRSFIPVDDESRDAMLMFVALVTASLLDPVLKRPEAAAPLGSVRGHDTIRPPGFLNLYLNRDRVLIPGDDADPDGTDASVWKPPDGAER